MSQQSDNTNSPEGLRDLTIIADDLTGACDAAVAFTDVGTTVRVHTGPELPPSAITVIHTNSRDLSPERSEIRLAEAAARVPSGHTVFKKIDSVFRGNTFIEIAAAIRLFPADLVVIAPAYPAMGRRMHAGILQIGGQEEIPVEALLRRHGCAPRVLTASADANALTRQLEQAIASDARVLLCDAIDQDHLEALVRAVMSHPIKPLWIGSGALGHAIAAQLPTHVQAVEPELSAGEVIFFIGSDHPVTRGQQAHLQRMSGIGDEDRIHPKHSRIVKVHRDRDDEHILRGIADADKRRIGCLFMTGGDTALRVCNALGITSLRLQREFITGVPMGVAEGGRFDGVQVILKSGGFGERDLLCRILDSFAGKECVYA